MSKLSKSFLFMAGIYFDMGFDAAIANHGPKAFLFGLICFLCLWLSTAENK